MNTEFITGPAGSGKTELVRRRVAEDPSYGTLASTTGISAINLGTRTLNSLLTYFDTASLQRKERSGKLAKTLRNLRAAGELGDNLIIDEVSMMAAKQLDIITSEIEYTFQGDVGIILTGDFGQLAPAGDDEKFAFTAETWPRYESNMTKLTKIYRQSSLDFLEALATTRRGDPAGAAMLKAAGANFVSQSDPAFPGVTLVPTNVEAEAINRSQLAALPTPPRFYTATVKGKPSPEWDLIPQAMMLKPGARVMVTANDKSGAFANGDLGTYWGSNYEGTVAQVTLDRTGTDINIPKILRKDISYERSGEGEFRGSIEFMPLKLAYGLTIHKCQGLTIPNVQLHINHWFAGEPALIYVAVSRVREAAHLSIVGTVEELAKRIKAHEDARRWL